jgi:hypothetical protein
MYNRYGMRHVDWIRLAQDRDKRRAVVNTVMNVRVSINCWEIVWLSHSGFLKKNLARLSSLISYSASYNSFHVRE